ncbi:hypothetical protein PEPS_29300 (plasmid) [Persicobacter psychrovividus]|uniref:Uncharacterized protein n=2 Tax=Persicobacter psychrovividus TaxID=387638 RepID=A0ABM7VI49_9BACT|nr:hypothetical protein PEPS_29300 [Persicobacter psychrovividus]
MDSEIIRGLEVKLIILIKVLMIFFHSNPIFIMRKCLLFILLSLLTTAGAWAQTDHTLTFDDITLGEGNTKSHIIACSYNFEANPSGTNLTIPEKVTLPDGSEQAITHVSNDVFSGKNIHALHLAEGFKQIGQRAFQNNKIKVLTLPPTIRTIGTDGFSNNLIESLNIPEAYTTIQNGTFENNKITTLTFTGNAITKIGQRAFQNNLLTSVTIPANSPLALIDQLAFAGNNLQQLTIPEGTVELKIGQKFVANNPIESVAFPSNLNEVHANVLADLDDGKPGYTPTWFSDAGHSSPIPAFDLANLQGKTAYAKWDITTYTLTFNGSSNHDNPETYTVNDAITLSPAQKDGYSFDGWYDNDQYTGEPITTIAAGTTGNLKFWAKLTIIDYPITYHLFGGENHDDNPATYNTESGAIPLADPTRENATFEGWFENENFSARRTEIRGAWRKPLSLYAKFTSDDYGISYVLNGGENHADNPAIYNADSDFSLQPATKSGHTFVGWYATEDFSGDQVEQISGAELSGDIILYAKFTIIDYTVSYELNGGVNDDNNPADYNIESETFTLLPATKDGYNFNGWFDNDDNKIEEIAKGSTGDISLNAQFTIIDYTISYELNGGMNDDNNPTDYNIESETFTLLPATKDGYNFNGWFDNDDNKIEEIAKGSTGDISLNAQFTIIDYTISYELNGGVNDDNNPADYNIESETFTLLPATKDGYNFNGWFDNDDNKIEEIAKGSTGDISLNAQFAPINYAISYVLNGGMNDDNNPVEYNIETETFNLLPATKIGFGFDGWFDNETFTGTPITTISKGSMGEIDLYAKFTAGAYTINYNLNGGVNHQDNPNTYTTETETFTLLPATKDGYNFNGWFDNNDNKIEEIAKGSTGDISLNAQFAPINYAISYVLNGGMNDDNNPVEYNIETETFNLLPATKIGFGFDGWFDNETFTGAPITTISKGSMGEIDLYAKFTAGAYTINYNLNGGVNHQDNPNTYTTETETFTLLPATKDGYNFNGWFDNDDNKIEEIAKGSTGDISLNAQFTPINYAISYVLNGGMNDDNNIVHYNIESATFALLPATKDGYNFDGWYDQNDQMITEITAGSMGDITLTAGFSTISYTINYQLNGGANDSGNPANYNIESATFALLPATKDGYTFDGWYDQNDQMVTEITAGSMGDITLTAGFSTINYTINYVLNGGMNDDNNIVHYNIESATFTLLPATKDGYNFDGWYDQNNQMVTEITAGSMGDITLTAGFSTISYTINYQLNGGMNDSGNPANYNIESATFALLPATKDGYNFDGWYDQNDQMVTEITAGSMGDITLTAGFSTIS